MGAREPALNRRVVITGAGVISSIGSGTEQFWDALERGTSGARRVELDQLGEVTACVVGELDEEAVGRERRSAWTARPC